MHRHSFNNYQGFRPHRLSSPVAKRSGLNSPSARRSAALRRDAPPRDLTASRCGLRIKSATFQRATDNLSLSARAAEYGTRPDNLTSLTPISRSYPGSRSNSRPASGLPEINKAAATRPSSPLTAAKRRLWDAASTPTAMDVEPAQPLNFDSLTKSMPATTCSSRLRGGSARTPSLRKSGLAAIGAVRLDGSLRKLAFVDRSTLLSFTQCASYFKEHWSTHALPGGAYRSNHASILGAVPCLAALLADVQRKAGAPANPPKAVTLVPPAANPPAPEAQLPAGEGADNCYVVHCDGDFARIRCLRADRAGGTTDLQAALVFHFAPEGREAAKEAPPFPREIERHLNPFSTGGPVVSSSKAL